MADPTDTVPDPGAAASAAADASKPEARAAGSAGPKLPFTRKQALIAGGGLLGVLILLAIIMGGGSSKSSSTPPPREGSAPRASGETPPPAGDALPAVLADANDRIAQGDREGALATLLRARRDFPDNAQVPLLLGRVYFAKLYWTDGIKNFRDAIRLDPSLRNDPELIKAALRGFITTPSVERDLETFLREDVGDAAIPYLEETAKDHPNPTIRSRASAELKRIH